ncbi:endolytic transglycosylase MltG [Roseibium porphyridii]|uniref:Endolytic murein transglycosylase n=1 Tax=Roseibium porphyridii TaxID=2866279 RepID=A0ABY8EYH0_9HYPH|nr:MULTISPECIES: endolytic transglycosylase MltG [Stappiaceae]QFT32709.1 putative aminodeoxychorismate lyase [Labrenzia sp. THAF82]WFE88034.1 endolytic transglycosylase MltG [Roseibium sp. KMA01]
MRIKPKSPREALQPEPAPEPPQRSRHVRNPLVILINLVITLAVFGLAAVGGALYFGKEKFEEDGPLQQEATVVISSGAGLTGITNRLSGQGVIGDSLIDEWIFNLGIRFYKNATKLKAGEYAFAPGVSMQKVMTDLVEGNAVVHSVTIPEGWTTAQILERVREHPILTGEITEVPIEGELLPNTYTFARGAARQDVLNQMKAAQEKLLAEVWERRTEGLPVETPEELVILASIVEKETALADERPRVAGVFVNRLNKNMRLQSDPTILYGLYGGEAWLKDRSAIKQSELRAENDYNTYQIDGLPPGPIGNPGRAAMEAVANPSRTQDLFFVADGTGGHVFAETYEQHQANVRKWREIERERRQAEQEQTTQPETSN